MFRKQSHFSKPWLVLLELATFGFFSCMLQVISIMALRSLDSFFTSASQLLLLLPVAGCILLVIVATAFADSQCMSYMAKLDSRLTRVYDLLQLDQPRYPDRFLQNIFLPMVVTLPAAPVIGLVLAFTAPWLFGILLLNLVGSAIIIARYNGIMRTQGSSLAWTTEEATSSLEAKGMMTTNQSGAQGVPMMIPSYLLRNRLPGLGSASTLEDDESASGRLMAPADDRPARRKRQGLATARTIYHGLILGASAILALLQLSSLGSIVGFFIISSNFRRAFLSLFEYLFPRHERISLDQAYGFLEIALLPPEAVEERLEEIHHKQIDALERFNQRYAPLIQVRPALRFRNVSLTHRHQGLQLDKITARIELTPSTLIRVPNLRLVQDLRLLTRQIESQRVENWHLDGDIICGGQKLTLTFLSQLPLRAPWKIRVASPQIEACFDPSRQEEALDLIKRYSLYQMLYGDDGYVADLAALTKRQLQRLRSLICLLVLLLEPACLSAALFVLEPFDEEEMITLIEMIRLESSGIASSTLFFTRRPLDKLHKNPCYELNRTSIHKLNS